MKKNKNAPRSNFPNSRKTIRKQKRLEKKVKRVEQYANKKKYTASRKPETHVVPGRFVKRPADLADARGEVKKIKQKVVPPTAYEILSKERLKELKQTDKLKSQMEKQRRKILLEANEDEDKVIKKLEKQLGLNKTKNKKNFFSDDGLDYLLEICDRTTTEQIVAAEKHLANVEDESDFEEDLATVTGKEVKNKKKKTDKNEEIQSAADDGESGDKEESDDDSSNNGDDISNDGEINVVTGKAIKNKKKKTDKNEEIQSAADDGESGVEDESGDDSSNNGDDVSNDDEICNDGDVSDDDDVSSDDDDLENNEDFSDEGSKHSEEDEEPPKKQSKQNNESHTVKKNVEIKVNKDSKKLKNKKTQEHGTIDDSAEDIANPFSDDEVSHLSGDDEDFSGDENVKVHDSKSKEKPDVWEDIYGRKRDKEGNIIKEEKGVYIPPHLRNKDSGSDKELAQLKRQIKSVLNKLAGTNLHWACTNIDNLYSNNSRNSVNSALTSLWLEATVATSVTPDRMISEHTAVLAVLQANVGQEIGAHFLQVLVKKFDDMLMVPAPVDDKRLDNLVACLSNMYSFKMYHADLLYDILNRLLEDLTEKNIDCILVCLRCVGGVLRKEQPLALKEFIQNTQNKISQLETSLRSRLKFLQEVLLAVKNNNLTKIPNYDPTYTEQLKKHIKTIIRRGNYITPLNIRLEDLLKADERGKWWIVGSAWEGNLTRQENKVEKKLSSADQKLLELARKQRMNTDVRRSIFCVIMAAEDYMDAFEKLQHLGLKGQQEREIIHVLMACCLQEKAYNPYYAVLGQKLCDFDRKYQLSIQYSVWDKIKELENLSKQCSTNLAQFLTQLIMEKSLPLSVLKVIEFSDLNKSSVRFMRQILLAIIMNADLQSSLEVFHRISKSPKLHMFRESLRLFIQHFLLKNAGKKTSVLSDEELTVLKQRTVEVDKLLTVHDSKLRF